MTITNCKSIAKLFAGIVLAALLASNTLSADIVITSGLASHATSEHQARSCPDGQKTDMTAAELGLNVDDVEAQNHGEWQFQEILVGDESYWPEIPGSTSADGNMILSVPEPRLALMSIFFFTVWLLTRRQRFASA